MMRPLLILVSLIPLLVSRIRLPKPSSNVVEYYVEAHLRCFFLSPTWVNVSLWEDDDSPFVTDMSYGRSSLRLKSFFDETGQKLRLGGPMKDTPWDSLVEPYLYVVTDCSHHGVIREFCVELPPSTESIVVDLGVVVGPPFHEFNVASCSKFENTENLRRLRRST